MKKYSMIPASSVPSEVSFSVANYIERKEGARLGPKVLRDDYAISAIELSRRNNKIPLG